VSITKHSHVDTSSSLQPGDSTTDVFQSCSNLDPSWDLSQDLGDINDTPQFLKDIHLIKSQSETDLGRPFKRKRGDQPSLSRSQSADSITASNSLTAVKDTSIQQMEVQTVSTVKETDVASTCKANDNVRTIKHANKKFADKSTKKVAFNLQSNNPGAAASNSDPPPPHVPSDLPNIDEKLIDPNSEIWKYQVIPDAQESWKVATNAARNEAKLEIRISYLKRALNNSKYPPWAYGLAACPEYLQPLPKAVLSMAHEHAKLLVQSSLEQLINMRASELRKSVKLLKVTEELYLEANDETFNMAKIRMEAMITQARKREMEISRNQFKSESLPEDKQADEWAELLPKRRLQKNASRENSPSPNRNGSPRRSPQNRGQNRGILRNRGRGRGQYQGQSYGQFDKQQYRPYSRGGYRGARGGRGYRGRGANKRPHTSVQPNDITDKELRFIQAFRSSKAPRN
jgi:hypothetical protein